MAYLGGRVSSVRLNCGFLMPLHGICLSSYLGFPLPSPPTPFLCLSSTLSSSSPLISVLARRGRPPPLIPTFDVSACAHVSFIAAIVDVDPFDDDELVQMKNLVELRLMQLLNARYRLYYIFTVLKYSAKWKSE